jgi:hypothetical protein
MSTDTITLLNTVSRVPWTYEAGYAKRLLADPHYGKILVEWDSEKSEVLGQSRIDGEIVDANGETVRVPAKEVTAIVKAQESAAAKSERTATAKTTKKD